MSGSGGEHGDGERDGGLRGDGRGRSGAGRIARLALLVPLVLGTVWLARQLRGSHVTDSSESSAPDALEILRREYASGRLSREDYHQRSDDLTARSS